MPTQQKLSGAYFTPELLASALVCWAVRAESDRMLDPSCGDGRFLIAHPNSVGIEQDEVSAKAAIQRAPSALVHEGDFFTWAEATSEKFECCAGNPPFIRYQHFKGKIREKALRFSARHGAAFSGLTSSWAPFLVAAATLLKPGGRMAFVVPAEIGHAPYAAPLLEFLVRNFRVVHVTAVKEKIFQSLSEDCWLLYAEGFGGAASNIRFSTLDAFDWSPRPPSTFIEIDLGEWRGKWNRRLRPYLLNSDLRSLYLMDGSSKGSSRLSEFARIGIGYVSGDNEFFHLRPSEVNSLKIPTTHLHPSVRNGRNLNVNAITKSVVNEWIRNDEKMLLLRLRGNEDLPAAVSDYLNSVAGEKARQGYKCRSRSHWYSVPDVQVPDFVLSYMSGRSPKLVRNAAGVTCTNSVHSIRVTDPGLAAKFLPMWKSERVQLSCELEGHPLGGGMLKLEVREAANVLFPASDACDDLATRRLIRTGLRTMRLWRHYAE